MTITVPAVYYEDVDDCLAAAERDACVKYGLEGWILNARWVDDNRDEIAMDLPAHIEVDQSLGLIEG